MDARALRSAALGIIAIARQFGVRITADTIDSAIERGTLKNPNQLENALSALGMATQLRRINPDSPLVRGNHTTVPPSRERDHFRGRLIT